MNSLKTSWDRRISRANQLAAEDTPAGPLLAFYGRLLTYQKTLYDSFVDRPPSGSIALDAALIAERGSGLLRSVAEHGPRQLVEEAHALLDDIGSSREQLLVTYWHARSDRQFFAKALLQPYGQWFVDSGMRQTDVNHTGVPANRCPNCGGPPQASILQGGGSAPAEGGTRQLLCATCLTTWPFRRVLCPHCFEDDEQLLGYFHSPALDHLRVDTCESCRRYLKTIDLGRLGLAVPLVDEVAGAPLDLWAREHGYEKIELNLVGL